MMAGLWIPFSASLLAAVVTTIGIYVTAISRVGDARTAPILPVLRRGY